MRLLVFRLVALSNDSADVLKVCGGVKPDATDDTAHTALTLHTELSCVSSVLQRK